MTKAIVSSMLVASAVAMSAPAYAATFTATSTTAGQGNASQFDHDLAVESNGDGSYSAATGDTLKATAGALKYFSSNYNLSTPVDGNGVFSFIASSSGRSMLTVLGFFVNGAEVAFSQEPVLVNGVKTIRYFADQSFSGAIQNFSVYGSLKGGGSVSTTTTFAAAVPEVSTWLMMMAGIGVLGGALRVNRRKVRFQMA